MPSHGTTSSGHCRHHLCRLSDLVGQLRYSRTNTDTEIEGSASAEVSEKLPDFNLFFCCFFRTLISCALLIIGNDREIIGFKQLEDAEQFLRLRTHSKVWPLDIVSAFKQISTRVWQTFGWSSGLFFLRLTQINMLIKAHISAVCFHAFSVPFICGIQPWKYASRQTGAWWIKRVNADKLH